jgi:hypothetical protein
MIAGLCAPLVLLGSARGQAVDAAGVSGGDAGAPLDGASPPPVETSAASPPDAAPPSPAPPLAEVVSPETMTGVATAPAPAIDVETPTFGRRGQIVVSGDSVVSLSSSSYSASGDTETNAIFSPSLAYFVAKNVSVGLAADASYAQRRGPVQARDTRLSVGPTFGVNIPISERFSWYPQLTIGFEWLKESDQIAAGSSLSNAFGYPSTTQLGPYVEVYAPVLFHPTDHFFFGFGPVFFHDFGSVSGGPNVGGQRTEISTDFIVGGYWGGEPASPAAAVRSTAPSPRFGDAGQFVFTNDLNLSVHWTTYAGSASTALTTLIGGSAEYFFIDNFATGFNVGISGNSFKGIDATSDVPVTTSQSELSFGPILAANFAIGRVFSIFPRVSLGIAHETYDVASRGSDNSTAQEIVSVGLYVPLLVHPAPHVFIGFGPSANYELSHSVSYPNVPLAPPLQNRETTWGAGLVVGGWL